MNKALLLIGAMIFTGMHAKDVNRKAAPDPKSQSAGIYYINAMTKTDFRDAATQSLITTYTILNPGTYTLVQDITFTGHNNVTDAPGVAAAIYVNSNNVTIDLGGKTIAHDGVAGATSSNGIDIANSISNITIKNGNISNFTGNGIRLGNTDTNIRIQDVTVSNCTESGIYLNGTATNENESVILDNVVVSNITGGSSTAAYGLYAANSHSILCNDCTFSGNGASVASENGYGAYIATCTAVSFHNCDASNNRGDEAYGFYAASTPKALSFTNCSANGNFADDATAAYACGFYLSGATGCTFENCLAMNNFGLARGIGFGLISGSKYNKFEGCKAINNYSGQQTDDEAEGGRGFWVDTSDGNLFLGCIASGNLGNIGDSSDASSMRGIGFDLFNSNYCALLNCEASNNGSSANAAWGVGIALGTETPDEYCSQTIIRDCKILSNQSNTDNQAFGVRDTNGDASTTLITNCLLFANRDSSGNDGDISITYQAGATPAQNVATTISGLGSLSDQCPFENTVVTPN